MIDNMPFDPAAAEEWFLENLDRTAEPQWLAEAVFAVSTQQGVERGWACAELLADKWASSRQARMLLDFFRRWLDENGESPELRQACVASLRKAIDPTWSTAFIQGACFDNPIPLAEALRRLDLLMTLQPGVLCYEKTWGFGVVKELDDFYSKAVIDFEKKSGHEMTLSYAAESLEAIGPEHLMARRHQDPEGLAQLVKSQPEAVVKIALVSYGPMSVQALQERLLDGVVASADWKRFWDQARKALKADKRVQMPPRRADPILLLEKEKSYDADWFADFVACTDVEGIYEKLVELIDESGRSEWSDDERSQLENRLGFAMLGTESRRQDLMARFAIQAQRLGLDPATIGNGLLNKFYSASHFLPAVAALPARDITALLNILYTAHLDAALAIMLTALPETTNVGFGTIMTHLLAEGHRDAVLPIFRKTISELAPSPVMLAWLAKHIDTIKDWRLISAQECLILLVTCMQQRCAGEALKAQNQIRAMLEKSEWMNHQLEHLSHEARADILVRVRDASEWDLSSRREVMAIMIMQDPTLERIMAGDSKTPSEPAPTARFTSMRSYRERARQYKHLIEIDIPENSRDIGVARSYGDLRENAEYESAKQQQGLLMKRKAEMELDLASVRETDFKDVQTDRVGMGTSVTIAPDQGDPKTYNILGEWDRDEALNIISCQTLLARTLDGRRAGDEVILPGESDEATARIQSVSPLPDSVRAWLAVTQPQ